MPPSPERAAAPAAAAAPQESGQLENLNEGQLRALLDEAVNYKTPKDLDGMSKLFKNLLHKAEQDEYLHGQSGASGCSGGFNGGKRGRAKRGLTAFPHSGSLQDLAGAGACPDSRTPRPQARHRRPVPVSQRSFHGGSLPANVDQQNFGVCENRHSFLEEVQYGKGDGARGGGGDYIATVRCVNPPPLGCDSSEYAASSVGERAPSPPIGSVVGSPRSAYNAGYFDDDGTEMELISSKKNSHAASYTTRATLEIGSPCAAGDSAVDRSVAFSLVDTNHGCISSPGISQPTFASLETKPLQLISSYNAVRSVTEGSGSLNGVATAAFSSMTNSSLNVIGLLHSQPSHQSYDSDKAKKHLDENYNSVQNVSSVANSGQHGKKSKRKKFFKNETETLAEQVDGYRGDEEDIDKILKFIESDVETAKHHGKYQSKSNSDVGINGKVREKGKDDNDNDKSGKKRSTERRIKDGKLDSKMKRANSMEEISHRKFDDLTNSSNKSSLTMRKSKKSVGTDGSDSSEGKASERRSWCNEEIEQYFNAEDVHNEDVENCNIGSDGVSPKAKKQIQSEIDLSLSGCDPFYNIENSDFQTVIKKKKLRKRHSPCDENRNHHHHVYNHHTHTGKIPVGNRSTQERNVIYKRYGHTSRPSASSPPSDKSNDSNDDLDSVHSLPADASGERLQASYADMARAAPSSSPPPPLPASLARQHNFPDLIESCNYYSNEVSIQEKHPDVSVENTKNLLLKSNQLYDAEMSNQTDHKAYVREQYPALESRHKIDRNVVKAKIDNRYHGNYKNIVERADKKSSSKLASKCSKDEIYGDNSSISLSNEGNSVENYVAFAKINSSINPVSTNEPYQNAKLNKFNYSSLKVENSSKPPDVVLPITEMAHLMNDELSRISDSNYVNRPPVIIMNEELNKTSHNTQNINGITFGFDINEQLINGDTQSSSDGSVTTENTSIDSNDSKSCEISTKEHIVYNSNIDFPAINEKPYREYHEKNKNNDDIRHSKKSNRLLNKDSSKNNNKNCVVTVPSQDSTYFKQNDINDNQKEDVALEGGAVVETYVGRDKALRFLTPTTTSKHIYNLDKIVHYVGMAWEDIIKSPGDKVRYFSEQQ